MFLSYARWDGKHNKINTRLCYGLLLLKGKYNGCFNLTLHPIHQYPFDILLPCSSVGYYMFGIRIFWIQLEIHIAQKINK